MLVCEGCEYNNVATRRIRFETYPGSGRYVERECCEVCYGDLGSVVTVEHYADESYNEYIDNLRRARERLAGYRRGLGLDESESTDG